MIKIGLIGSHGVGKTSLAFLIASELKREGFNVNVITELIRECPLPINKNATKNTFLWLFSSQIKKEIEFTNQKGLQYLICDRTVYDPVIYASSLNLIGDNIKVWQIMDFITNLWHYDYLFFIPINKELKKDGFRDTNLEWQKQINGDILRLLEEFDIKYYTFENIDKLINNVLKMRNAG
jgi:thymidylate kinase